MDYRAKILKYDKENLELCAKRIRNNQLVAIPTETVYGLGGNALNKEAYNKIFEMKKRPKTDPLIVHVLDFKDALNYFDINENEKIIGEKLSQKFWPGPLTLLMRKNNKIDNDLTNNSDFVGMRCPNNPIALELIKTSKLPIAAPSANLFCHISPTKAKHVLDDFKNDDLMILEGGNCKIGMESTIIKIENKDISIFRWGGINKLEIEAVFNELPFKLDSFESKIKNLDEENVEIKDNISPGQFIKHYAPNCLCKLFIDINKVLSIKDFDLKNEVVLIDFGKENIIYKDNFLKYYDLSEKGDLKEAMHNFYSILRDSELIKNIKLIIILYLSKKDNLIKYNINYVDTIIDKQLRSTSGTFIN